MSLSKAIFQLSSALRASSIRSVPTVRSTSTLRSLQSSSSRWVSSGRSSSNLFGAGSLLFSAAPLSVGWSLPYSLAMSSSHGFPTATRMYFSSKDKTKISDPSQITTETQFQIILKKSMKALGNYVDTQETGTKKLRKIITRFNLLTQCQFSHLLPTEVTAFSFYLLSQLIQGRGNVTEELMEQLLEVFSGVINEKADEFKPAELARIFWALAEVENSDEDIVENLCRASVQIVDQFEFHDIVNVLISFYKYRDIGPAAEFVDDMSHQLLTTINTANAAAVAGMFAAVCPAGHQPSIDLLTAGLNRLAQMPDQLTPKQIASVLFALGPLQSKPENIGVLQSLLDHITGNSSSLNPRWITRLMGGATVLDLKLSPELIEDLSNRLLETTNNISPTTISDIFMAFGMSKSPMPAPLADKLVAQALAKEYKFKGTSIGNTFIGHANLGVPVPAELLEKFLRRALLTTAIDEIDDILCLLQGLSEIGSTPSADLLEELVHRTTALLESPDEDMSLFFDVYTKLKDAGASVENIHKMIKEMTGYDPDKLDEISSNQPLTEGQTTVVDPQTGEPVESETAESQETELTGSAETPDHGDEFDGQEPDLNLIEDGYDEIQNEFEFLDPPENEQEEQEPEEPASSEDDA